MSSSSISAWRESASRKWCQCVDTSARKSVHPVPARALKLTSSAVWSRLSRWLSSMYLQAQRETTYARTRAAGLTRWRPPISTLTRSACRSRCVFARRRRTPENTAGVALNAERSRHVRGQGLLGILQEAFCRQPDATAGAETLLSFVEALILKAVGCSWESFVLRKRPGARRKRAGCGAHGAARPHSLCCGRRPLAAARARGSLDPHGQRLDLLLLNIFDFNVVCSHD
jgi:hypothetical protein